MAAHDTTNGIGIGNKQITIKRTSVGEDGLGIIQADKLVGLILKRVSVSESSGSSSSISGGDGSSSKGSSGRLEKFLVRRLKVFESSIGIRWFSVASVPFVAIAVDRMLLQD